MERALRRGWESHAAVWDRVMPAQLEMEKIGREDSYHR